MARILVVYGTTYGQTEKIVRHIDQELTRRGHEVSVYQGDQLPAELNVGSHDSFLVAASVIGGKHQRCIREFVRRHSDQLNAVPSGFLSVSGSAANSPDKARASAESFLRQTTWRPRFVQCVAGSMAYTKYRWWLRWIMKHISRSNGGPTDTSQDHELTDWGAVDRFAALFSDALSPVSGRRVAAVADVDR
jgi:menaquinone-dependent protoporphyrinogen oxidase